MLKIDRGKKSFSLLDTPTLADVSITERNDLQEYISNTPDEFFKEIGQELFLLGKEVEPSKNVQDRIDLLAVDKEGIVIVNRAQAEQSQAAHATGDFLRWDDSAMGTGRLSATARRR